MDPLKYMGFFSVFSQAKILRLPAKSLSCMVAKKKPPKPRSLSEAAVEALKASADQHGEEHHQSLPLRRDLTRWARPPPSKVQDGKRTLGEDAIILR